VTVGRWATSHEVRESHGGDTGGGCANGDCGGAEAGSGAGGGGGAGGYRAREYANPTWFYKFLHPSGANSANAKVYTSARCRCRPIRTNVLHVANRFTRTRCLQAHRQNFTITYDGGRGMNRTASSILVSAVKPRQQISIGTCSRNSSANRDRKKVPID